MRRISSVLFSRWLSPILGALFLLLAYSNCQKSQMETHLGQSSANSTVIQSRILGGDLGNSDDRPLLTSENGPGNGGIWEGKLYYFINPLQCALLGKPLEIVATIIEKTEIGYQVLREKCEDLPVAKEFNSKDLFSVNFMPEILIQNSSTSQESSILEARESKPVFEKDGDEFIWMACSGNMINPENASIRAKAGGTIRIVKDSRETNGVRVIANVKVTIPKDKDYSGDNIPLIYKNYENHHMRVVTMYHEIEQVRFRSLQVLDDPIAQANGDQFNRLTISVLNIERDGPDFGKHNATFRIPWNYRSEHLFHFGVTCHQINPFYIEPGKLQLSQ